MVRVLRFLFGCLVCTVLVSCQELPEPALILQKAIEAHGGEENIKKPRKGILKGADNVHAEMTQEEFFDLPDRWKRTTSAVIKEKRRAAFLLVVDDKCWKWEAGGAPKETENEGNETEAKPHLAVLTLLLELQDVKLSPIKGVTVDSQLTVGFRAEKGETPAECYFAKDTGLLVQTNFKWQSAPGNEFATKLVLSDFREVDGVKLPYRRTYYIKGGDFKNTTLLSDFQVKELKIVDKLPDDTFDLP